MPFYPTKLCPHIDGTTDQYSSSTEKNWPTLATAKGKPDLGVEAKYYEPSFNNTSVPANPSLIINPFKLFHRLELSLVLIITCQGKLNSNLVIRVQHDLVMLD